MNREYNRRYTYDQYGRISRGNQRGKTILHVIFGFLVPYIVLNGIILALVVAKPTIEAAEPDTRDYDTASFTFSVKSLLPLKSVTALLGGDEVPIEKDGNTYSISVESNGNVQLKAVSMNGMTAITNVQINLLDETAPVIDENSANLGTGYLEFTVSDDQSGVDFSSIYAIDSDGNHLKPTNIDQATGSIMFAMPTDSLTVYVKDNAGNEMSASFNVSQA